MKIKIILAIFIILGIFSFSVYAVDNNKPDSHNATWERGHGKEAKRNSAECYTCHEERLECISCHEDTAPRSHNAAWVNMNHGLESRWNKQSCTTCHKEDFCSSCHESAVPRSHARAGFGVQGSPAFHCTTSCQLPYGSWQNTPVKNCITCHKVRPITSSGVIHQMN